MSAIVETINPCLQKITITVPKEEVTEQVDQFYTYMSRNARVNGFRPGKVPASVIKKQFASDMKYEVTQALVNKYFPQEMEAQKINPISTNNYTIKKFEPGSDFEFEITFEIHPQITPKKLSGFTLEKFQIELSEKDLKDTETRIYNNYATFEKTTREAVIAGDNVMMDFEGFKEGQALENTKGENYRLEIGSGNFIPGFEEQLIGKKAGSTFDIEVTFPQDYHAANLQNQKVIFKVTIHEIQERKMPTLDADFYKKISPFDNRDGFINSIKTEMLQSYQRKADEFLEAQLKMQIIAGNPEIPTPESMLQRQKEFLLKQTKERLTSKGYNKLLVDDFVKISEPKLQKEAQELVTLFLIFHKIIEDQKLAVTDQEVEAQILDISKQFGTSTEEVQKHYSSPDQKNELKGFVLEKKVLDYLKTQSQIKTTKVSVAEFDEKTKQQNLSQQSLTDMI